jgi:hypothetical protein
MLVAVVAADTRPAVTAVQAELVVVALAEMAQMLTLEILVQVERQIGVAAAAALEQELLEAHLLAAQVVLEL